METTNINVRIKGALQTHLKEQIGDFGLYENASEYIRALIRRDLLERRRLWDELKAELKPGLDANENVFVEVTAEDVISRNTKPNPL